MTPENLYHVEKFKNGLKGCIESRLKHIDEEAVIVRQTLFAVLEMIDLHFRLAEIDSDNEAAKMADAMEKEE